MDIKALQWELAAFVVDRGLDPLHTPRNLSMALAAEAGALLALFKWATDDAQGVSEPAERDAAADALADAVLHAVNLADRLGIDLDEAIRRKLAKNAEKYPVVTDSPPPAPAPERRVEPEKKAPPPRPRASGRAGAAAPGSASRARHTAAAAGAAVGDAAAHSDAAGRGAATPCAESPARSRRADRTPAAATGAPASPRSSSRAATAATASEGGAGRPPPPPPPARAARVEPPPPPPPPPEPEVDPYADLDTEAARRLVEVLTKQVNRARSDDPLARELHDEVTTLKRTLYADDPKRAWVASSLKSIRRILEEATSHSVGAELRAAEHLAEVERILDDE